MMEFSANHVCMYYLQLSTAEREEEARRKRREKRRKKMEAQSSQNEDEALPAFARAHQRDTNEDAVSNSPPVVALEAAESSAPDQPQPSSLGDTPITTDGTSQAEKPDEAAAPSYEQLAEPQSDTGVEIPADQTAENEAYSEQGPGDAASSNVSPTDEEAVDDGRLNEAAKDASRPTLPDSKVSRSKLLISACLQYRQLCVMF
mgnify:CR=1 FL=1